MLSAAEPPKVSEIEKKVRQARQPKQAIQIPQIAVFDGGATSNQPITALEMLRETVKALVYLERAAGELPVSSETEQALARAEQAIVSLRRVLQSRG